MRHSLPSLTTPKGRGFLRRRMKGNTCAVGIDGRSEVADVVPAPSGVRELYRGVARCINSEVTGDDLPVVMEKF